MNIWPDLILSCISSNIYSIYDHLLSQHFVFMHRKWSLWHMHTYRLSAQRLYPLSRRKYRDSVWRDHCFGDSGITFSCRNFPGNASRYPVVTRFPQWMIPILSTLSLMLNWYHFIQRQLGNKGLQITPHVLVCIHFSWGKTFARKLKGQLTLMRVVIVGSYCIRTNFTARLQD